MIEAEALKLREERRAKMKEIKENLTNDLWNRDGLTSAPNVVEVDEFHEELSAAEKQKRLSVEKQLCLQNGGVKSKIQLTSRKVNKEDILESNLISEAAQTRQGRKQTVHEQQQEIDDEIADIFDDDEEETEIYSIKRSGAKSLMIPASTTNDNADLEDKNDINEMARKRKFNSFRDKSQTRTASQVTTPKVVDEFKEHLQKAHVSQEFQGQKMNAGNKDKQSTLMELQSKAAVKAKAASAVEERPQSYTTKVYDNGTYNDSHQSPKSNINKRPNSGSKKARIVHEDPLSQSLPTWSLKNMKKEEKEIKCVYDPRLFKAEEKSHEEFKKRESFKDFLNASFASNSSSKKPSVSPTNEVNNKEELDCIDLNENEYESITTTYTQRSASPTISIRTVSEFGEPNHKGHAKPLSSTSNRFMGQLQTVMGTVIGTGQGNANMNTRLRQTVKYPDEEDLSSEQGQKGGGKKDGRNHRNMSCWALIFLLAVDAFTIGLVLVLFSHHSLHTPEFPINVNSAAEPRIDYPDRAARSSDRPEISKNSSTPLRNKIVVKTINVSGNNVSNRVVETTTTSNTTLLPSTESTTVRQTSTSTTERQGTISQSSTNEFVNSRDARDIIIRKSVEVHEHDSPSMTSTTTTFDTSTEFSITSEMYYGMQEEIRMVRNQLSYDIKETQEDWRQEIENLKREITLLKKPPAFACHKTETHAIQGRIQYNDCNIITDGMNPGTGIFTVQVPGIYHFSFTGLFFADNGHGLSAHIMRQRGSSIKHLATSKADTDERGFGGVDDDLHSTITVITMDRLEKGDKIFIKSELDGNHGDSVIISDRIKPAIHFVGHKVSD